MRKHTKIMMGLEVPPEPMTQQELNKVMLDAVKAAQYALTSFERYNEAQSRMGRGHCDSDPRFTQASDLIELAIVASHGIRQIEMQSTTKTVRLVNALQMAEATIRRLEQRYAAPGSCEGTYSVIHDAISKAQD